MIGNSVGKAATFHATLTDRLSKKGAILVVAGANLALWSAIVAAIWKFI